MCAMKSFVEFKVGEQFFLFLYKILKNSPEFSNFLEKYCLTYDNRIIPYFPKYRTEASFCLWARICVGQSFTYVTHFRFLRDVWIQTQRDALAARRRVTNLASHIPLLRSLTNRIFLPEYLHLWWFSGGEGGYIGVHALYSPYVSVSRSPVTHLASLNLAVQWVMAEGRGVLYWVTWAVQS